MKEHVDWFALAAQAQGVPENWRWHQSEVRGERPHSVFIVRGAVPGAMFTRGKNKGKPNPAAYTDKRELVITHADLAAAKAKWEAETGKCHVCLGTGQEVVGWSSANGETTKPCKRCGETGAKP